ncbi:DUF4225 domain-containing protein [Pseudomonas sp. NPDC089569]|uniref:DUF4225 domain-containing protein n=1 Tax=Pseudomonas sp. NPDC089569 TaxID=3390722 RepID=UPI003D074B30
MNEDRCDIHDVKKAASDLVAFGCSIGAPQLFDSFLQLKFSSMVSSYANGVIKAVDEGLISARQGLQEIKEEYAELLAKALFYGKNGTGILAGFAQIHVGTTRFASSKGLTAPISLLYIAHGTNNIYEGMINIYRGPNAPETIGPVRNAYRKIVKSTHTGDNVYYEIDLALSAYGLLRKVRKPGTFELFNRDPINYERAYTQIGRPALALEILSNAISIDNIRNNTTAKQSSNLD